MNKKVLIIVILLLITGITVGYGAFTAVTSIDDISVSVRVKKDVRITGISVSSSSSEAISNYEEYDVSSVSTSLSLPNDDSTVTYKIDITNFEAVEVGVLAITGLPDNLKLSISKENYVLGDKICYDDDSCNLGITKEIYATIGYKDGVSASDTAYVFDLIFDFRTFHNIEYENITNNGYPSEIIDGGTLNLTFTGNFPKEIKAFQDGVGISSVYDETTHTLTITNVTGDLKIVDQIYSLVTMISSNSLGMVADFGANAGSADAGVLNDTPGVYEYNGATFSDTKTTTSQDVYFYRGAIANNNIKFAGFCWQIVRTTTSGGLKIIYNGIPNSSTGACDKTGTDRTIGASAFNSVTGARAAGWMYGTSASPLTNTNNSLIKTFVENWYKNNIYTNYDDYVDDVIWCNDRSLASYGTTSNYYFAANERVYTDTINTSSPYVPTLYCSRANDRFTVGATPKLTYKVGLLTSDEATLAGNGNTYYSVDSYLTISGYYQWLMSPHYSSYNGALNARGRLIRNSASYEYYVRPVIALKSGILISGTGTSTNPYVVYNVE